MNVRGTSRTRGLFPHRFRPLADNPLRRRSDRCQSWLGACLLLLLFPALLGVPLLVAQDVYASQMRTLHTQSAQRQRITVRVTADAVTDTSAGLSSQRAPVRWTDAEGTVRTGTADVPAGSVKGATVPVWVDDKGRPVKPPMTRDDALAVSWSAACMTAAGLAAAYCGMRAALVAVLNRQRYAQWEAEWEAVEPRWSGRSRG
ncbi:hypothetical protein [Streptomyces sp. UNOC14_S4]|uniref:Rv1733c family protein n=1 Tax=Streptomyces sp. UNOC14_S4 TaxID=2872340 RepID=UPI001E4E7983|nr:hypothetical protein [Streptomyces sp. UNOC14_S4]MCC3766177.1 hypothetical protein [Streptomyces sp. UNOC14_S4]